MCRELLLTVMALNAEIQLMESAHSTCDLGVVPVELYLTVLSETQT